MPDEELETLLQVFKVLSDRNRLKILGLLATQPYSVEELASALELGPPTVSHHLSKLKDLDIVRMQRDDGAHIYSLNSRALDGINRRVFSKEAMASWVDDVDAESWERKVLRDFFDGDRLRDIPRREKKRLVVLRHLAEQFQPGRTYRERRVNEILAAFHPDHTTLRRYLVDHGLLERDPRRSVYWRSGEDTK